MMWILSLITLAVSALVPVSVDAVAVAQSSEVVLIYEQANEEQQGKYSFVYTVDGDDTIYACDANRCDTSELEDRSMVSMSVYKLPEGYPRPQGITSQKRLQEFVDNSEQTYRLEDIATNLQDNGEGKPFFNVNLSADGTAEIDQQTYDKADPNTPEFEEQFKEELPAWLWPSVGGLATIVLVAGGILLFLKRKQ